MILILAHLTYNSFMLSNKRLQSDPYCLTVECGRGLFCAHFFLTFSVMRKRYVGLKLGRLPNSYMWCVE
jgi:hypothetical protein